MILGLLGAILPVNLLACKGVVRFSNGNVLADDGVTKPGNKVITAGRIFNAASSLN